MEQVRARVPGATGKGVHVTHFERMTSVPVPRLAMSLCVPSLIGMMIGTLYNLVDTWFVARLGTQAVGACGIAFAIMEVNASVGFLFGMGGGTRIARLLGARSIADAEKIGSTALAAAACIGICIAVPGVLSLEPLMYALGSSPTILPYAMDYSFYILLGLPIMCCTTVLGTFLRCEGKNRLSMLGLCSGAVLNIILDPLLIFTWGLGIRGAAIATLISQIVSFGLMFSFFLTNKSEIRLSAGSVAFTRPVLGSIIKAGIPSLVRHGVVTLSTISINFAAGAQGGDVLIAAMSIVTKIGWFVQALVKGAGHGVQPVMAYNKGAGRDDRVFAAWKFGLMLTSSITATAAVVAWIASERIIALFTSDAELLRHGAVGLVIFLSALIVMPWNFMGNTLFQCVGLPLQSAILASLPEGVIFVPALFVLPSVFGPAGVAGAWVAGHGLCALITIPFVRAYFGKYKA